MTLKLERPSSSSAQTSPSRTQSGVRTARSSARATTAKRPVRSLPRRLVSVGVSPRDVRERPVAVPLPRGATRARGNVVGERREHGLVGRRGRPAGVAASRFRTRSQFFSSPSSRAGTSVAPGGARRPASPSGRRRPSPRRARTCPGPRSRPCRAVLSRPGSRPRRSRSRAGGPRRGRRGAAARAPAGCPSGRPSSQARRHARGGSRSGAGARRAAGRRRSACLSRAARRTAPGRARFLALVVSKARHADSMPEVWAAAVGGVAVRLPTGGWQTRGRLAGPFVVRSQRSQGAGDNPVDAVDCGPLDLYSR